MRLLVLAMLAGCACGGGKPPLNGNGNGNGSGHVPIDAVPPDAEPAPPKVLQLNETGVLVDIDAALVPGYVTIVDFWADWCGACKTMEDAFMPLIADEPRILVRKVDVGDGDTPVAEHYDIGPLPHLRIYDTHGKLQYILLNNNALETGQKALEVLRQDQE